MQLTDNSLGSRFFIGARVAKFSRSFLRCSVTRCSKRSLNFCCCSKNTSILAMKWSSITLAARLSSSKESACSEGPRFNGSRQRRLFSLSGGLGIGGIWVRSELLGVELLEASCGEPLDKGRSIVSRCCSGTDNGVAVRGATSESHLDEAFFSLPGRCLVPLLVGVLGLCRCLLGLFGGLRAILSDDMKTVSANSKETNWIFEREVKREDDEYRPREFKPSTDLSSPPNLCQCK